MSQAIASHFVFGLLPNSGVVIESPSTTFASE
jgi:hypothetical protein